jgi:type IV pilus assembly protein PilB
MLLEEGLISRDQLDQAVTVQSESGMPLGRVLVDEGLIEEGELVKALARQIGLEYVDLSEITIDPAAAALVPDYLAERYSAMPLGFDDAGKLIVAMADPANVLAIDDMRAVSGYDITPRVATRSDVEAAVRKLASLGDSVTDLADLAAGDDEIEDDLSGLEAAVEEAPVVKLMNTLITRAVNERASDIHIEPGETDLRVRFRIDGVLAEVMTTPRSISNAIVSRLKIMADINIAERRVPQDGRVSLRVAGRPIDLRVATLPSMYGEKVVIRILDNTGSVQTLESLGFLPDSLETYKDSYTKPYGAILVTGPTGSGKTTTLYSTLEELNEDNVNIITVEDPVEYRLEGLTQVQVNRAAGLTFGSALKSILRSDPDVVLVGEIRDAETAKIGIEAALTGHLVLSTLHTNDAASSIGRLIEMGVEPYLVSSAVDCVLAQRLARRLCEKCKVSEIADPAVLKNLGPEADGITELWHPRGCSACSNTGYLGRVAVVEVLKVSEDIQRLAVERRPSDEIKEIAAREGMKTLRQDGMEKVRLGMTSLEEVLRVVV